MVPTDNSHDSYTRESKLQDSDWPQFQLYWKVSHITLSDGSFLSKGILETVVEIQWVFF